MRAEFGSVAEAASAREASMTSAAGRLLIVMIPAFNEVASVGAVIHGVQALSQDFKALGFALKIVVVDDGSTDGTAEAAIEAGADRLVRHRTNMGLGAAVRSGLDAAVQEGADLFVKIDADFQHHPEDILSIIAPITEGSADLVYGERFSQISYKMPFVRRTGNIVFRTLMRWLTKWPIEDSQPGIFAAGRDYLSVYDVPGDYNYTQQILVDAYLKGMRFAQVPVRFDRRLSGQSFVSLRYPFKVLPQLVLVVAMSKPMKIFGTGGLLFLLLGFGVFTVECLQWLFGYAEKPVMNVNLVLGSTLFGLQMLFFGILAKLIILTRPSRNIRRS